MANKVIVNGLNIGYLPPTTSDEILYVGGGNLTVKDKLDSKVSKSGDTMNGDLTVNTTTTATMDNSSIVVGNDLPEGTVGCSRGVLRLYGRGQYKTSLFPEGINTKDKWITIPDKDGTMALTSDLGVCDTLLEAQNIPTTATLYNCNWQNYYFLSIEATFYNNVMEQMIIPTSYFNITGSGARPQIYDGPFSCLYQVYKQQDGKVYILASKSDTNRGIRIYGIMKKPV